MNFCWKIILALLIFSSCSKDPKSNNAVVVTRHHLATDIGAEILKNGGNAIDSAVAVAFALAVVNPSAGNLGGGGFMLYYDADDEKTFALDYRERAPQNATEKMFLNKDGDVIKGVSLNSYLASGVPGTVKGMFKAHNLFGSIPIENLIAPAIKHAASSAFIFSGIFLLVQPIGDIMGILSADKNFSNLALSIFDIFPTSPKDLFFDFVALIKFIFFPEKDLPCPPQESIRFFISLFISPSSTF